MSCCGEDGVGAVSVPAFEEVPAEAAAAFQMTDDGLDRRAAAEFAFDLSVNAAPLAGDEDAHGVLRVMAAIALVDIGALDVAPGQGDCPGEDVFERVAVVRGSGR